MGNRKDSVIERVAMLEENILFYVLFEDLWVAIDECKSSQLNYEH